MSSSSGSGFPSSSSPSSSSASSSSSAATALIGMKRKERDPGGGIDDVAHGNKVFFASFGASLSTTTLGSGISPPSPSRTSSSSFGDASDQHGTSAHQQQTQLRFRPPPCHQHHCHRQRGTVDSGTKGTGAAELVRERPGSDLQASQGEAVPLPSTSSSSLSCVQGMLAEGTHGHPCEESLLSVGTPEEELLSLRTIVGSITQGIGQLQHALQRLQAQWHFQRVVGQLSELSQELSGQLEQTTSLYSLLQTHNAMDEMNRKGSGFFSILPEECILHALSFLPERDLATVARLNRQFKRLTEDDTIWRSLAMRRWKKARERGKEKASKRRRHGWREYFLGRCNIDKNWESGTYALRTIIGHDNQLYCIQFDEDKIVSGSEDETMKVWDLSTGKCLKTLRGHTSGVWCLQFWHDRLLSGSEDSTIRVWDLNTGNCEHILNGHKYGVWSLQFDDRTLVSGAEDQTIKMWDMNTLQCKNTLLGHKSDIWCLQFDAAQHLIVSGSGYEDRTLKIWDMRTCTCVMTLTGHMGAVNSLCVFYGSQSCPHRILSGSADQTIKVWDRRTGSCETTLEGHQGEVLCLKMADSRNPRIVSGGGSTCKTIKVWDDWYDTNHSVLKRKECVSLSLSGHENGVWGLQYDEDKIISGSADKTIRVWDFSLPEEELQCEEHQEHVEFRQMMEQFVEEQIAETIGDMEPDAGGGEVGRVVVRGKRKHDDYDF